MSPPRSDAAPPTVVLAEKGGRFFVYDPTLRLIASDDSVGKAYDRFASIKRAYLDDLSQLGLNLVPPTPPPSAQPVAARSIVAELGLFFAKMCIVIGVVLVGSNEVFRSIDRLGSDIDRAFGSLSTISLDDVVAKASAVAQDAQDLPANRKEVLRHSIGVVSRELAPFVDAWRNPP